MPIFRDYYLVKKYLNFWPWVKPPLLAPLYAFPYKWVECESSIYYLGVKLPHILCAKTRTHLELVDQLHNSLFI